jgi:hypothetical protein
MRMSDSSSRDLLHVNYILERAIFHDSQLKKLLKFHFLELLLDTDVIVPLTA